ncbi:casein kinase II beta subunit, partial [Coprinopsis marcescibilis]
MAVSATREERMCQMVEHYAQSLPTKTFGPPVPPIHLIGVSLNRCAEDEDASKIPDVSIVESSAEMLYGLVHQRFILTRAGLQAMAEKYENGVFGSCPRVYCVSCNVVPCGRSDMPGVDTVKLFCPNCNDIFVPPSSRFQGVDGAFFGTTFAHLFFQTYRELAPAPFWKAPISGGSPLSPRSGGSSNSARVSPFVNPNPHGGQKRANGFVYVPRIYGFKVS